MRISCTFLLVNFCIFFTIEIIRTDSPGSRNCCLLTWLVYRLDMSHHAFTTKRTHVDGQAKTYKCYRFKLNLNFRKYDRNERIIIELLSPHTSQKSRTSTKKNYFSPSSREISQMSILKVNLLDSPNEDLSCNTAT